MKSLHEQASRHCDCPAGGTYPTPNKQFDDCDEMNTERVYCYDQGRCITVIVRWCPLSKRKDGGK